MDELHNVSAQSPTNGDTLRYNSTTSLWEKSALGTLATQSGTFSGTSSGTNTGDQTATTVSNTPAGGIAATTVQAALNELDSEKTTAAAALAAADAADLSATAALIEREGLRFDGTAFVPLAIPNPWSSSGFEYIFNLLYSGPTSVTPLGSATGGLVVYVDSGNLYINHQGITNGCTWALNSSATVASVISITYDGTGYKVLQNGVDCVISSFATGTVTGNRWNYSTAITQPFTRLGCDIGTAYWNGSISRFTPWNYVLTVAERSALTRRGLVTLPEQRGGRMTSILTGDASTFTSSLGGWAGQSGGTATNTAGKMVITTMDGGYAGAIAPGGFAAVYVKGRKYKLTLTVSALVGGSFISLVNTADLASAQSISASSDLSSPFYAIPAGTNTYYFSPSTTGNLLICAYGAGSPSITSATIDDITVIPLGTLFEQDSGQRNAGYMVRDTSGNGRHLELPETGVSIIDPADTGFIEYTRATDGYLIGDRRVIPSTGYLVEVVATGNGTATLGESAGTPANVCASVTLTSTPKILPILVTQTSTGKLYADLGTATTATFKIRHRAV
jgi:hypothetical protein